MSTLKKQKNTFSAFHYLSGLAFLFFTLFIFEAQVRAEGVINKDVFESVVIKVIDGDTVRLKDGTLVRYLGIDAPELKRKVDNVWIYDPEPYAEAAAKYNKSLVEGKPVIVEIDPVQKHDQYGRLLAYIYVDKVLANEEMLRKGFARAKTPSLFMKHRIRFWSIEEMAWTGKLGLWSDEDKKP